jgi:predicted nuclease of restriction endonuclease-like RecB superfamily
MVPPDTEQTAAELVIRYNLALVQSLLMRSVELVVRITEHVALVIRVARVKGLLVHARADGDATLLTFSGPLSLLRDTTKYGHALASFFPTVLATPDWSLSARVRLEDGTHDLELDHRAPIRSAHVLPVDTDGRVGRRLMRDVRKLRTGWEARPESVGIDIEGELFFPDFTLERQGRRALVEIVGFWTEEYLREKLKRLRAAPHVLVCVDRSIASSFERLGPRVLPFEKFIDAAELLRVAERHASP